MRRIGLLCVAALLCCNQAMADDWRAYRCFRRDVCQDSDGAGEIARFDLNYNFVTGEGGDLFWTVSFRNDVDRVPNVVWLVLTDGVAPAQSSERYAIFYLDLENEQIFVYEYDPTLREHSWQKPNGFITRGDRGLTGGRGSGTPSGFSAWFALRYHTWFVRRWSNDVEWRGIAIGEEVGFSVSGVAGATFESNQNGITNFSYPAEQRTSFDRAHEPTDREFAVEAKSWGLIKRLYR